MSDAENWARRNPALVLGGAFALGLLASRFLKSGMGGRSEQNTSAHCPYWNDPYYDRYNDRSR